MRIRSNKLGGAVHVGLCMAAGALIAALICEIALGSREYFNIAWYGTSTLLGARFRVS